MSVPVGIQLWTLRNECERDFFGTLKSIAEIGYRWIEPYDFYGAKPQDLARVVKDNGLGMISSHVSIDLLMGDLDRVMDDHDVLECKSIICPWLDEERRKDPDVFKVVGRFLNSISPRLAARGFRLAYHNHEFEFTLASNPNGLEQILAEAESGGVGIQLDVYWASFAGLNPAEMISQFGPRLRSIHLKDGDPKAGTFSPVGGGAIDMPSIVEAGRRLGVESFIVEQDECVPSPLECARCSLEFLRGQGLS